MSERDKWIYELGQRHPNLAFEVSDAYVERRGKDKDEIAKLNDEIARLKRVCERSAHVLKRAEVHLPFGSDEECLVEEHLKEISEAVE